LPYVKKKEDWKGKRLVTNEFPSSAYSLCWPEGGTVAPYWEPPQSPSSPNQQPPHHHHKVPLSSTSLLSFPLLQEKEDSATVQSARELDGGNMYN
jgi:hypothetical protein